MACYKCEHYNGIRFCNEKKRKFKGWHHPAAVSNRMSTSFGM